MLLPVISDGRLPLATACSSDSTRSAAPDHLPTEKTRRITDGVSDMHEWVSMHVGELMRVALNTTEMYGTKVAGRRATRELLFSDHDIGERLWRKSWPRRTTSCFNANSF